MRRIKSFQTYEFIPEHSYKEVFIAAGRENQIGVQTLCVLFSLTEEQFAVLWLCLAYQNIANDLPKQIKSESAGNEDQITKQLYKDYSEFKRELFADLKENNPQYDKLTLFKKSQKLLDRLLFILFAEDGGLLPPNSIGEIIKQ